MTTELAYQMENPEEADGDKELIRNVTGHNASILTDDLYEFGEVYLLSKPLQCLCIVVIIVSAVALNLLVINNVRQCDIKMRSVNFLLIKNLCIVDLVGALLILPVPLIATAKGRWDFNAGMCTANSIINVALWFQHIVMFFMLKCDRVMASCLPIGRYPLFPVQVVLFLVILTWIISFFVAGLVTSIYGSSYEPAVVLCIPDLPIGFFITIFSVYCLILFAMVTGYIFVILGLKRKQAKINQRNRMQVVNYKSLERAALTSFLITVSHFLLYVPTMLVIGLHGWFLHPVAILFCDLVVYAEFLIHPLVLMVTSTRMRHEIADTVKRIFNDYLPWTWMLCDELIHLKYRVIHQKPRQKQFLLGCNSVISEESGSVRRTKRRRNVYYQEDSLQDDQCMLDMRIGNHSSNNTIVESRPNGHQQTVVAAQMEAISRLHDDSLDDLSQEGHGNPLEIQEATQISVQPPSPRAEESLHNLSKVNGNSVRDYSNPSHMTKVVVVRPRQEFNSHHHHIRHASSASSSSSSSTGHFESPNNHLHVRTNGICNGFEYFDDSEDDHESGIRERVNQNSSATIRTQMTTADALDDDDDQSFGPNDEDRTAIEMVTFKAKKAHQDLEED